MTAPMKIPRPVMRYHGGPRVEVLWINPAAVAAMAAAGRSAMPEAAE